MSERSVVEEIPTRILLEAMVASNGNADAALLYEVGNALGMSDQQIRLGIRRAVAAGDVEAAGRGRHAILTATDGLRMAIAPDIEFLTHAYAQDAGSAPWDGRWHLVSFAVAEADRRARDELRAGIVRLGGAPIQGGVYVSPNAWEPYVAALTERLGVTDSTSTLTTTDLRVGALRDPASLARRLWALDDVAGRYARFIGVASELAPRLPSAKGSTVGQAVIALQLAHALTRAMEPDPLLPPELLPQRWLGSRARAMFADLWSRLESLSGNGTSAFFALYDGVVRDTATRS